MKKFCFLISISLVLSGCFGTQKAPEFSPPENGEDLKKSIYLQPVGFFNRDTGFKCLPQFLVHNNTDKDYKTIRFEVSAYTKDNKSLSLTITPNVSPEEALKLREPKLGQRVSGDENVPAGATRISSHGVNLEKCPEITSLELFSVSTSRWGKSELSLKDVIVLDKITEPKYVWRKTQ